MEEIHGANACFDVFDLPAVRESTEAAAQRHQNLRGNSGK